MSTYQIQRTIHQAEIRRSEILQKFQTKRSLFTISDLSSQMHGMIEERGSKEVEKFTITAVYQNLKSKANLESDLQLLVTIFADHQPFLYFDLESLTNHKEPSASIISNFIAEFISNIMYSIFGNFDTETRQHIDGRIKCINIISNVIADRTFQSEMVPSILTSVLNWLQSHYGSLQLWGIDQQTRQIGWLVGNILRKDLLGLPERSITYALQWAEGLMEISNSDMLGPLYKGITTFFFNLDSKYSRIPHQRVQHYQAQRSSIIESTIIRNLKLQRNRCLLIVLPFLEDNIVYILEDHWISKLVDHCLLILNAQSNSIYRKNIQLLITIAKYSSHARKRILRKHIISILKQLIMQPIPQKSLLLNFIEQLLVGLQPSDQIERQCQHLLEQGFIEVMGNVLELFIISPKQNISDLQSLLRIYRWVALYAKLKDLLKMRFLLDQLMQLSDSGLSITFDLLLQQNKAIYESKIGASISTSLNLQANQGNCTNYHSRGYFT